MQFIIRIPNICRRVKCSLTYKLEQKGNIKQTKIRKAKMALKRPSTIGMRIAVNSLKFSVLKKLNFLQLDHKIQWFAMFNDKIDGKIC